LLAVRIDQRAHYDWLRVMRVFRLSKTLSLSRYKNVTNILEIFSDTAMLARHSFTMLLLTFLYCTIVLATITYTAEERAGTFVSVFEALYWCVITQTTLGYGDIPIVTPVGRLLACVTAYIGIINLTFMINVLGSCFDEAYTRFLAREEQKLKERLILELSNEELKRDLTETVTKPTRGVFPAEMRGDLATASAIHTKEPTGARNEKVSITSVCKSTSLSPNTILNESSVKRLVLKLTKLLGQLIESDFSIQSNDYASIRQSMIELRELLDKEI